MIIYLGIKKSCIYWNTPGFLHVFLSIQQGEYIKKCKNIHDINNTWYKHDSNKLEVCNLQFII